ncbi:MAG: hypothetical protein II855_04530 [Candidatus Methanomethylophilaceae archaeon]|nr:hypothetical protein [Candidatus Methanomethylophilaceae archaeon]
MSKKYDPDMQAIKNAIDENNNWEISHEDTGLQGKGARDVSTEGNYIGRHDGDDPGRTVCQQIKITGKNIKEILSRIPFKRYGRYFVISGGQCYPVDTMDESVPERRNKIHAIMDRIGLKNLRSLEILWYTDQSFLVTFPSALRRGNEYDETKIIATVRLQGGDEKQYFNLLGGSYSKCSYPTEGATSLSLTADKFNEKFEAVFQSICKNIDLEDFDNEREYKKALLEEFKDSATLTAAGIQVIDLPFNCPQPSKRIIASTIRKTETDIIIEDLKREALINKAKSEKAILDIQRLTTEASE